MTVPSIAAGAYSALQRIGQNNNPAANLLKTEKTGPSFGALLENTMEKIVEQGHATDMKARDLASGKGDLIDVVTAVADSEVTVQTLVSVRDKMIAAYEDIMKMPI
jgi:flagellar hook-basal body complex protein FliE